MSTAYNINFYSNGHIDTIKSEASRNRKDINHPQKTDTFRFTINSPAGDHTIYYSVRVFTKDHNDVEKDAPDLFNYQKAGAPHRSAYVPFGWVFAVADGARGERYYYTPSTHCPGHTTGPGSDPVGPPTDGPPDTGSIKVGS